MRHRNVGKAKLSDETGFDYFRILDCDLVIEQPRGRRFKVGVSGNWIWANNMIREIRHLIKTGAPQRAQIFVIGPKDMKKGAFNVAAFKFKTVNAIGRDELAVKEHLRQAIIAAA